MCPSQAAPHLWFPGEASYHALQKRRRYCLKLPPSRILSLARVVRGFMTGQLLTTVLLFRAISFRDLAQTPQKKALAGSPDDDDVSIVFPLCWFFARGSCVDLV